VAQGLTHNKVGCPIFATVSSSIRWAFAPRANRFPFPATEAENIFHCRCCNQRETFTPVETPS
jgi:hypothetical protein